MRKWALIVVLVAVAAIPLALGEPDVFDGFVLGVVATVFWFQVATEVATYRYKRRSSER